MSQKSDPWLELLFENRNKEYGAYKLRLNYETRLIKSFAAALGIFLLLFSIPFLITKILTKQKKQTFMDPTVCTFYKFENTFTIEKNKPAATAPKTAGKSLASSSFKIEKQVDELPAEKPVEKDNAGEEQGNTGPASSDLETTGSGSNDSADASIPATTLYSAAAVDTVPEFPGGLNALYKFLSRNLTYPTESKRDQISGTVYTSFVINESGGCENIEIQREPGPGMGAEVIRVLNKMPAWKPGVYKGHRVKTIYNLPVRFTLK